MMLSLLSTLDAAFVVYYLSKKQDWQLAFNPEIRENIFSDEKVSNQIWMYQVFVENAIKAGELPAKQIFKGRTADKKVFEKLGIPKEVLNALPQSDYWITLEDLFAFIERPSLISNNYAHGRDALARLLCALIDSNVLNEEEINEHLAHKIETREQILNVELKLGDNTLKGCCREILDTLSAIKNNNLEE